MELVNSITLGASYRIKSILPSCLKTRHSLADAIVYKSDYAVHNKAYPMREKKEFQAYDSRVLKQVPGPPDLRPLCMSCTLTAMDFK